MAIGLGVRQASRMRRLAARTAVMFLIAAAVGLATPIVAAKDYTVAMDGTRFVPRK